MMFVSDYGIFTMQKKAVQCINCYIVLFLDKVAESVMLPVTNW